MQRQRQNKDLYKFPSERKKGVIATIIFHAIIVVILIISGFRTPLPLPEEEGILVNFGYDQTGSGVLEPAVSSSSQEPAVQRDEGETDPVAEIIEELTESVESVTEPEEEILTQDFEEAPVIEKKVEQADPEEVKRKEAEAEAERLRLKELEEKRIRKAAEEAERIRIAEEEARIQREAEEREKRRSDIFNRTRDALSNAEGTGSDTSQGVTGSEGNQGVETGSVGSNVYGEGGGTGTDGISYDLAGRKMTNQVKPKYEIQNEGIVVVEITVDRNGNVTKATPGVRGSTTLEEYFLRVAREAAMATKFDRKPDAAVIQRGTITYHFILR